MWWLRDHYSKKILRLNGNDKHIKGNALAKSNIFEGSQIFYKQWELEERMKLDNWHFVEYSKNNVSNLDGRYLKIFVEHMKRGTTESKFKCSGYGAFCVFSQ